MSSKLPVLFIAHGAPDILLQKDPVLDLWRQQALSIPKPHRILIVSAHWETNYFKLSGNRCQRTIHDFCGFSARLYDYKYKAKSNVGYTNLLAEKLDISTYNERGLDHGAWVPLIAMYPEADIPVSLLSVVPSLGCEAHFKLGQQLEALRSKNVLIIASGVITHNLSELQWGDCFAKPDRWATSFMSAFHSHVDSSQWSLLFKPHDLPNGARAVPTLEHYLPFLIAAGAAGKDKAVCFSDDWRYANLGMHSYRFGEFE